IMHTSSSQDTPHVERTSFDHLLHNEDNETGRKGDKEDGEVTPYVLGVALCASISGLMFGIDTAIISGTLVSIKTDLSPLPLTTTQKETITSATTVGALIGGLSAGIGSDMVGRKGVVGLANGVFVVGALVQIAARSVPTMVLGRMVVGLGVGLASCIIPLYIGELAPSRLRGRMVTINVLAITLGQCVAYAIGAGFQHVAHGWRYMIAMSAVPALAQLGCMAFLPESPRILLKRGQVEQARAVLANVYNNATSDQIEEIARNLHRSVKQSAQVMEETTFRDRAESIWRIGGNRRALIVGAGLQALQQLSGFNSLMYYSSTLFASLGFHNSTAVSSLVAVVNFAFTLVALKIVDPFGRRRTMLWTLPGMIIALFLAAYIFTRLTAETGYRLEPGHEYPREWTLLAVSAMLAYVASYATGLGCIPWAQGELFRLEVRGIGTSLCTATNWACNLVVSATFLSLMEVITPGGAFALYGVVCVLGYLFCYACQPETAYLTMEQTFELFTDDFGIGKWQVLRAARLSDQGMEDDEL
ncbi:hypothetical protein NCC49_005698, partial [Naganishia albida]